MPSEDLKALAKVMGVDDKGTGLAKELTSPSTAVKVGQRSVLDGKIYGPGNRPYWDMKEGQERSRYPNLIRALARERDPGLRSGSHTSMFYQKGRGCCKIESKIGRIINSPDRYWVLDQIFRINELSISSV